MTPTTPTPPQTAMAAISAGTVATDVVRADARGLLDCLDRVLASGAPEAVHFCRVAVRRLRTDVRMFRPLLDRRWVSDRRHDLDGMHRALATVRHLDVRADHLRAAAAGSEGLDDEVGPLLQDHARIRSDALAALRATLTTDVPSWLRALADGTLAVPVDPAPGSDAHLDAPLVVPALLRRPWRHVREARRGVLDDSEELRVWSRRCRYAAEALTPVLGPPAAALAASTTVLHVALGEANEAVEIRGEACSLHQAGLVSGRLAKAMRRHADQLQDGARRGAVDALATVLAAEDVTRTPASMQTSRAGGGVVWRPVPEGDGVEVVVVHRPRKGDWSLPKGRLRSGEAVAAGARREIEEETGLVCSFGASLPPVRYVDRRGRRKEVQFWAMQPLRLGRRVGHEVDEVRWLPLDRAIDLVDKRRDREVLTAFAAATSPRRPLTTGPSCRVPVLSVRG
ncbi:hypothetical protein BH24ACT2_BH24ACT2_01970 [soil metagenome]